MIASDQVTQRPEFATYEAALPSMLHKHKGQFVVIHGSKVEDYFDSRTAALDWAYEKFGLEPFFVKLVSEEEQVAHFIRDIGPCAR